MLYDFSLLPIMKKEYRRWYIRVAIVFSITIALLILIAFFVNDVTKTWLQILSTVILVIGGWISLYFIFNKIVYLYHRIRYFEQLNRGEKLERQTEIVAFNNELTLGRDVTVREVIAQIDGQEIILYWDLNFGECPLAVNRQYLVLISGNFILSFKEKLSHD